MRGWSTRGRTPTSCFTSRWALRASKIESGISHLRNAVWRSTYGDRLLSPLLVPWDEAKAVRRSRRDRAVMFWLKDGVRSVSAGRGGGNKYTKLRSAPESPLGI